MKICQGDIFWAQPDDSEGFTTDVPHPHVVLQEDVFNQSRITTVVVCALTSNLNRAKDPGNVLLESGEANLTKQSVVVVSQVFSIQKSQLGELIGSLSSARVQEILAGMRFLQNSFFKD